MLFNRNAFNAHLSGPMGQTFFWRRRSQCPCVTPGSGQHDISCRLCHGHGHLWADAVKCRAGQSTQSPSKSIAMFGGWESGDAILTVPSSAAMYCAGQYDRILSRDSTSPFSMAINPERNNRILGTIVEISRVFWLNDAKDAVIEGGIPTIGADGEIIFGTGAPPVGRQFTIEGVRHDEWLVYFPQGHDRNVGVSGLPRRLPVRFLDVVLRQR